MSTGHRSLASGSVLDKGICVIEKLAAYLPTPVVVKEEGSGFRAQGSGTTVHGPSSLNPEPRTPNPVLYRLDYDRPKSIGRVRAFFGNTGVLFRAYCYIRSQGPEGLRRVALHAVLNAKQWDQLPGLPTGG